MLLILISGSIILMILSFDKYINKYTSKNSIYGPSEEISSSSELQ